MSGSFAHLFPSVVHRSIQLTTHHHPSCRFIDRHEDACQLYERCLTVVDKQLAVLGKYYADAKQDAENFKASLGADFKEEEEDLNNNKDEDDDDNNNMGLDNDARAAAIAKLADLRALISQFANNLTSWKELKHQIAFFIACAAHKLEDKNKEERFYEVAADIRKELLKPFTSQNVEVTATFVKETQKFIKDIYDIDDEEDDGNNGRKVPKMDSSAMTKTDGKGMLLPAFNKYSTAVFKSHPNPLTIQSSIIDLQVV